MESSHIHYPMIENTSLINCINDSVLLFKKSFIIDENYIVDVNKSAQKLFGYGKEEFLSLSIKDLFHKTTFKRIINAKDLSKISEGYCVDKTGKAFPVEFYSNAVDSGDDTYILVIKDISNKKQNEEQLSRYIEELHENKDLMEKNAFELVLLNLKLEESEECLKELNASKDKFFSIIAHDLKSPFTSFIGLTELLAEDIDEMEIGEVKTLLYELNQNAQNVYGLLENLLSWSRVQIGRMDYSPEFISPFEIENKIKTLFLHALRQKKIRYTSCINSERNIFADRNMVETVLRNLVSNALKFTNEGGEILVSISDKDDTVEFSIQDSGIGIEKENISKLFQIESTRTTPGTNKEKGTGLGLILCKDLVERCGGCISVESKIGIGSKFSYTVPTK